MTEISALNQAQFIRCQALKFFLWSVEEILSKSLGAVEWELLFFLQEFFGQSLVPLGAKANDLNSQISCAFGNVFPTGIKTISQKAEDK